MFDIFLSEPLLYDSQLKVRLNLALSRMKQYPMDINFIMMDLERPPLRQRHADHCTYDLTGRTLQFYSLAEGINGEHIEDLHELYERVMLQKNPSGTFAKVYGMERKPNDEVIHKGSHFITALVCYYDLTRDMRSLRAAEDAALHLINRGDAFFSMDPTRPNGMRCWMTEPFAELYRVTKKEIYLDAVKRLTFKCVGTIDGAHSHAYMTTLRGILKAAIYADDNELANFVKIRYHEILDKNCILPNGDVCEALPKSSRNEGCSIADWIMLNLYYGDYFGDDEAFVRADHALWNALYFNQFVTGGFGHRWVQDRGYRAYVEEAWWCCTDNAGMCMAEIARHVVTCRNGELKVNFLIPGNYKVQTEQGEVRIDITTSYPTHAYTIIRVEGTKEDIALRIPDHIKCVTKKRIETVNGYEIHLDGVMGHYIEEHSGKYVMKYGPLIIAPMLYMYEVNPLESIENTVPKGYMQESLASKNYALAPGEKDENGFYRLSHNPIEWIVYEEGEMAGIGGGEVASATVPVVFPDGKRDELYFQPLCSQTSNLTLKDMIYCFDTIEE